GSRTELAPGVTEVRWEGVDAVDSDGNEYSYSVREVDEDGNDYTPLGYKKEENGLTITNTLNPEPIETSITLEADKELVGRGIVDVEFQFLVEDTEGDAVSTGISDANGSVDFDAITYTEVGTHSYTIREVAGDNNTIDYDDSVIKVTVDVTNQEGKLVATPS